MSSGIDQALSIIRKRAKGNELTYAFVMDCLKGFSKPRDKLTKLLRSGALIRLKQGFYVFNELFVRGQICKELLANLMYGPSYISLEWAMGYYGLIPERVEGITSVSYKRNKIFDSPLGRFSYFHGHPKRYSIGVTQVEISPYQKYLIATKEKALCDLLIMRRGRISSFKSICEILFEDFRIDEEDLEHFDLGLVKEINRQKPHSAIIYLIKVLEKLRNE
ncbi:MAG: hypothetical protein ACI9S8_000435 [Chlamydiales bacterium]|jgi:hypothetical protein